MHSVLFIAHSWCIHGAILVVTFYYFAAALVLVRCCCCCCWCAAAVAAAALVLLLRCCSVHSVRILCALSVRILCAFSVHSLCVMCAFSVQWSEVCSYQSSGDSATFCNWSARAPFGMGGRVISVCVKSQQSRACC